MNGKRVGQRRKLDIDDDVGDDRGDQDQRDDGHARPVDRDAAPARP